MTQWEDSMSDTNGYGYGDTSVTNVGLNRDSRIRVGTLDQEETCTELESDSET